MNEHRLEEQLQRRGNDGFGTTIYEQSLKELVDIDLREESREEACQLQQNTQRTL